MTQRELFQDVSETAKKFGIHLAYGEKVELDGTTLIPVAIAGFGGGAGAGEGQKPGAAKSLADAAADGHAPGKDVQGSGQGAGFGGSAFPVGAYISDEFGTRFQPNIIALLLASAPVALIASCGLPRLIKAIKR